MVLFKGDCIGGYRIIELIGQGAMGEVYLGENVLMGKQYAIKVLTEGLAHHPGFKERFQQEARIMAQLEHPHIVQIRHMNAHEDTYYIAMAFISSDGKQSTSLEDVLKSAGKRLPASEVESIMGKIINAVEYAHSHEVIHRDLKPSNILLGPNGEVKVSDFGLAKVVGKEYIQDSIQESLSQSLGGKTWKPTPGKANPTDSLGGQDSMDGNREAKAESLVGTYHYMPPEVQNQGEWSKQGDIYSLGVIAYRMLVGEIPQGRFDLPSEIDDQIPVYWDDVLDKALKSRPERRWESVCAFREALEGTNASRPVAPEIITPKKTDPKAVDVITIPLSNMPSHAKPLEMVYIPAGTFMMGSPDDEIGRYDFEGTLHRVILAHGFYMGKYQVTQAQWEAVMGDNPSRFSGKPNNPVENVSWNDCQAFIEKLNQMGQGTYRLPTEAEWEYACRAGTQTRFYWGDDPDYAQIKDYAWYDGNSGGETNEVGQKKPNAWGLYDMSGNVFEWCQDWYGSYDSVSQNNPTGAKTGSTRVGRGGSWCRFARHCRSAHRGNAILLVPDATYNFIGFRVLLERTE
jgi:eukaryotic-like serine/threonine-protein kinase